MNIKLEQTDSTPTEYSIQNLNNGNIGIVTTVPSRFSSTFRIEPGDIVIHCGGSYFYFIKSKCLIDTDYYNKGAYGDILCRELYPNEQIVITK